MKSIEELVGAILDRRRTISPARSLLVGLSGIDASGKGWLTDQLLARLALYSANAVKINVDGWLNLPHKRFGLNSTGLHFYENAIRFEEFFAELIAPLRNDGSIYLEADFTEETSSSYRKHTYDFKNVQIILVEGIFLFRSPYRTLFDLAVWVDCSFSTALGRALKRGQEGLTAAQVIRAYETIYFPAQRIHFERDKPRRNADLVFDNDPFRAAIRKEPFP